MSGTNDHLQHAVDLEIIVTTDGMDIGLFAPAAMLSLEAARGVVAEIKEFLDGLVAHA